MKRILKILTISLFSISLFSCADLFQGKIPMDPDYASSSLSDLFAQEEEITKLDAPAQVFASQGVYSDTIMVSWTQSEDAASYRLERAVVVPDADGSYSLPEEGDFYLLREFVYSTVFEDKILSSPAISSPEYGYRYFYRVCAENLGKKIESSDYTDVSVASTRAEGYLLPPPSGIDATKGKSRTEIVVSWNKVDGASMYKLYRGENENGTSMELLSTVYSNSSSYTDTINESKQGTEFYYKVCAVVQNGSSTSESIFSALAMGYSLKEGAPVAPSDVTVVNGKAESKTSLTVSWSQVAVSEGETITYSLFRTSSKDSIYNLVARNISSSTTSYTDTNIETGVMYWYYLQTIKVQQNDLGETETVKSAYSESGPDSSSPAEGCLLSAPVTIEVQDFTENGSVSTEKVKIVWQPAVGSDMADFTYEIYSSESQAGPFSPLTPLEQITENEDGSYSAVVAVKKFYKIATLNTLSSDGQSELSEAAAPVPQAPQNVTATKTVLKSGWVPNENNVYPVLVTWDAPSDGADGGYYVFRSTKADSGFKRLTETPVSGTEYLDENQTAKPGMYYYYKVVSLNVLGQGTKGNDPSLDTQKNSWGYGALTADEWFREYNKTVKNSQKKLTLMHKSNDLDKLGSETVSGTISGSLSYYARTAGLGAEITMHYENYADFYIDSNAEMGVYFLITGNTDTSSNMSANGNMHGTAECTGMYPGSANYDNLQIKGGAAGGGTYVVTTKDLNGNVLIENQNVDWTVGEE